MNLILTAIGAFGAILYVGYFAYSINELPLTVIVTLCLALMVVALYRDFRKDQGIARAKRESGK